MVLVYNMYHHFLGVVECVLRWKVSCTGCGVSPWVDVLSFGLAGDGGDGNEGKAVDNMTSQQQKPFDGSRLDR